MAKKSFAEKEYEKALKADRIANWEDQIAYYKKEIRDICARVGHGDIEIGSEEFTLSMEIVDGDAHFPASLDCHQNTSRRTSIKSARKVLTSS